MLKEIATLQAALKECILTESQRVAIRNEIGEWQDQISLLDFQENDDFDFGWHAQWE